MPSSSSPVRDGSGDEMRWDEKRRRRGRKLEWLVEGGVTRAAAAAVLSFSSFAARRTASHVASLSQAETHNTNDIDNNNSANLSSASSSTSPLSPLSLLFPQQHNSRSSSSSRLRLGRRGFVTNQYSAATASAVAHVSYTHTKNTDVAYASRESDSSAACMPARKTDRQTNAFAAVDERKEREGGKEAQQGVEWSGAEDRSLYNDREYVLNSRAQLIE